MAEHRGAAARNHPREREQPVEPAADDAAFPDRAQQLCLDAGRALALCGVLVAVPPAFYRADDDAAGGTALALVGFLLWITGAWLCLLALSRSRPRGTTGREGRRGSRQHRRARVAVRLSHELIAPATATAAAG
jgi:hypothetical protein